MKKLLFLILLLPIFASAQYLSVGNALQRTADGYKYRTALGSPGYAYWYTKSQIDSAILSRIGLGVVWGNIGGILSNQTDLQNALNLKEVLSNKTATPSSSATAYPNWLGLFNLNALNVKYTDTASMLSTYLHSSTASGLYKLKSDSTAATGYQTVGNFFPLGDTRWLKSTTANLQTVATNGNTYTGQLQANTYLARRVPYGGVAYSVSDPADTVTFQVRSTKPYKNNTVLGLNADTSLTTGDANTILGRNAARSNQGGREIVAIGDRALESFVSDQQGAAPENGLIVAIGSEALNVMTQGQDMVGIGQKACLGCTYAQESVSIGAHNNAGVDSTYKTVSIGRGNFDDGSGGDMTLNRGVAIGYAIGQTIGTKSDFVMIGHTAGQFTGAISGVVWIGSGAGNSATGNNTVFLGYGAGQTSTSNNSIYLGNNAGSSESLNNQFIAQNITDVYFGSGRATLSSPTAYTIHGSGVISGVSNSGGAPITIAAGLGTGTASYTGTNGGVFVALPVLKTSGTTPQTLSNYFGFSSSQTTDAVNASSILNFTPTLSGAIPSNITDITTSYTDATHRVDALVFNLSNNGGPNEYFRIDPTDGFLAPTGKVAGLFQAGSETVTNNVTSTSGSFISGGGANIFTGNGAVMTVTQKTAATATYYAVIDAGNNTLLTMGVGTGSFTGVIGNGTQNIINFHNGTNPQVNFPSTGLHNFSGNIAATYATGTAGTDAVLVNHGGVISTIAANSVAYTGLNNTFTANGAASTPAALWSGLWYGGGTGSTTKAQLDIIESGATASTTRNTYGTGLSINASKTSQDLINLGVNGTTYFKQVDGQTTVDTLNVTYLPGYLSLATPNQTVTQTPSFSNGLFGVGAVSGSQAISFGAGNIEVGGPISGVNIQYQTADNKFHVNGGSVYGSSNFSLATSNDLVTGYIPYTGATASLHMGSGNLVATGQETGGSEQYTTQSFDGFRFYDNGGHISWLAANTGQNATVQMPGIAGMLTVNTNTPQIQGTADLTAQTTAGNITTYTVGLTTTTFNISMYVNVTAVATDVIQGQVTYTDENNTAQTVNLTSISTVTNSQYSPITIRAKNGTVITAKTNLTTGIGSITFDAGARITQY